MKKSILAVILIASFAPIMKYQAVALTASEVRDQMDTTNSQIAAIDKEIQALSTQISKTSEQKNTLANTIKELNLTKSKLVKEREQIQNKITVTGLVIQIISGSISEKQKSIDQLKMSLVNTIRDLNESDNTLFIEKLLAENGFDIFSNDYNNILSYNEAIRKNLIDIQQKKQELASTKTQKESEQQNLNDLKSNLLQKEQVVAITQKEKDSLLIATKNTEATYQKMLAEQLKKKETFENALQDYEAQLKFILNPKLIPKEGSGVLSWPLSSILVTSPYGARWGAFHYGVDFRASIGTSVKAMASGTVEGTGDTDVACKGASFGKWVFIRYANGLSSTYGHLSVITSTVGQRVKAGDVVGLSGNTGSSTAPHLHVAVYASQGDGINKVEVKTVPSKSCDGKIFTQPISPIGAYLNPILYLPKITASMYK